MNLTSILFLYAANIIAIEYYSLVSESEGNNSTGLSLRYVPAMGYSRPLAFGNCEKHGPTWAIHYVTGYLFWPPIVKQVCNRPCWRHGGRCRPTSCETRCIYRFVWHCYYRRGYLHCRSLGFKEVCYEHHNACKCACAFSRPYCYF